jgi:hypothetical protein
MPKRTVKKPRAGDVWIVRWNSPYHDDEIVTIIRTIRYDGESVYSCEVLHQNGTIITFNVDVAMDELLIFRSQPTAEIYAAISHT